MSDSVKKYHELKEEGKICDTAKNIKVDCGSEWKRKQIEREYYESKYNSEAKTSMSTYFVSKFLEWLVTEYNITKRNHKL